LRSLKSSHNALFDKPAIETPNNRSAGLVFLNLSVPDAGSIEALKRIKKEYPSTAVIVINAGPEDASMKAFRKGGDRSSRRPVKPDEILEKIKALLESETVQDKGYPGIPSHAVEGILRVRDFIAQNPSEPLNLSAACRMSSLCKTYFCRYFKQVTGHCLSSYHHVVKIQKAEDLLGDKRLSIKEVAYRLGYIDSNYFSTVYKRITGISPRKRRTNVRNNGKINWKFSNVS
jgi:AraC-like DNA-binding protein